MICFVPLLVGFFQIIFYLITSVRDKPMQWRLRSLFVVELADFGLAIEVTGEQTQWHGESSSRDFSTGKELITTTWTGILLR